MTYGEIEKISTETNNNEIISLILFTEKASLAGGFFILREREKSELVALDIGGVKRVVSLVASVFAEVLVVDSLDNG